MKNTIQILSILGAAALFTLPVSAGGPPHHNEGVGLATDIVRLVKTILAPPPAVVVTPPVVTAPAPVVVTPPVVTALAPVVVTPPVWTAPPPRHFRAPGPPAPPHGPHRGGHGGRR